jgi:hypothetical protein
MFLMDVSLAHAREVSTRPVMEGVLRTPPRHGCAPVGSHDGTTHAGGRHGRA